MKCSSFDVPSNRYVSFYSTIVKAGANKDSTIVPASAISADNLGGRIAFDDTVANFDVDESVQTISIEANLQLNYQRLQQYLSGTGNRGGPLVTTANKTVQSDLRLFESDSNVTIKRYAQLSARSCLATKAVYQSSPVPCSFCLDMHKLDISDDRRMCPRRLRSCFSC